MYCILDLETDDVKIPETNKSYFDRLGNFYFSPIVAVGWKFPNVDVNSELVFPYTDFSKDNPGITNFRIESLLENLLKNTSTLVCHNISFDYLHLWKYNSFQSWLKNGGKAWCTMFAEYNLTGQQHKYPGLRDIAVNKYGCPEREKFMEEYWTRGVLTHDIPIDIIKKDVESDCLDTEQIYLTQVEETSRLGMLKLLEDRMDGLLGLIEMEYNGLHTDKRILQKNKEQLKQDYNSKLNLLNILIKEYWK